MPFKGFWAFLFLLCKITSFRAYVCVNIIVKCVKIDTCRFFLFFSSFYVLFCADLAFLGVPNTKDPRKTHDGPAKVALKGTKNERRGSQTT